MKSESNKTDIIDLGKIFSRVWEKRKLFLYKVWPITFVLSCLIIICVPRSYTTTAKLAPETGNMSAGGTFGSIASAFGIDLNNIQTSDAINPLLYPDLMEDNAFVARLFDVRVKSADGKIDTDYFTYLQKHQKSPWWSSVMRWITGGIKSILPKKEETPELSGGGQKSPYWMTEAEEAQAGKIRANIHFSIDKQTAVITIDTKAQDALICKTLADSVQLRLQQFITDYRTNKARIDEEHYHQLLAEARADYEQTCADYARLSDANQDAVLKKYQLQIENMERDMEMKYTTLQTLNGQLQMASAKVQERTPAFTVIKGASVPQRASEPKRMIFVIGMLFIVTLCLSFWLVRDIIFPRES